MAKKDQHTVSSLTTKSKKLAKLSTRTRASAGELRDASRELRRRCADLINPEPNSFQPTAGLNRRLRVA